MSIKSASAGGRSKKDKHKRTANNKVKLGLDDVEGKMYKLRKLETKNERSFKTNDFSLRQHIAASEKDKLDSEARKASAEALQVEQHTRFDLLKGRQELRDAGVPQEEIDEIMPSFPVRQITSLGQPSQLSASPLAPVVLYRSLQQHQSDDSLLSSDCSSSSE